MRGAVKPVQLLLCVCLVGFATLGFAQVRINERTVYGSGGFPYRITQPGSYILGGNLIVPVGSTDGIDISADNVTLDMNGFTISAACPKGGTGTCSSGIGIYSGNDNTKVTNGSVVGFKRGLAFDGLGTFLDRVSAKSNDVGIEIGQGVLVGASGYGSGTVRNCSASRNGIGMELFSSVVEGNTFSNNQYLGLGAWSSTVLANTFQGNFGDIGGANSVFGTNSFSDTSPNIVGQGPGFTSQNNNNCNGTLC